MNTAKAVTQSEIKNYISKNKIQDSIVCLHSSLKSFGHVEGGASSVIDAFLESGCTLVCPAFFWDAQTAPLVHYEHNASLIGGTYSPVNFTGSAEQIDSDMGIIPRTLLTYPGTLRTDNALNSFCVNGPLAAKLIKNQDCLNGYSIYKNIMSLAGGDKGIDGAEKISAYICLAGVDLTSCTPLHYAEEAAGRHPFHRWGLVNGTVLEMETGSCSDGFNNLEPFVQHIEKKESIGNATMRLFPFVEFINLAADAIQHNREITVCPENCARCQGMVEGGFKK